MDNLSFALEIIIDTIIGLWKKQSRYPTGKKVAWKVQLQKNR